MKLFFKIFSIVVVCIGIIYVFLSITALLHVEPIAQKIVEDSSLIPHQFLPELKRKLIRNDIFILFFGLICIAVGIFVFIKNKMYKLEKYE